MKRGLKKFIKLATAGKGKLPKKTKRLRELVDQTDKGVALVKLTKDGTAIPRKSKQGATHVVTETENGGAIAEPLKKWRKHKGGPVAAYGPARLTDGTEDRPDDGTWHGPIPEGASWLMYTTSTVCMFCPLTMLGDFKGRTGKLSFGKLRYQEDFVSMMPGEEGNVTRWRDGLTVFAEGNSPADLKAKEATALAKAARANSPETKAVLAAGRALAVAKRTAPAGPRPDDIPGVRQAGVRKPGAGGKTARVWDICDELLKKLKRTPTKAEVLAIAVDKEGASPGMTGTQHSYWRRFYNHAK